MSEKDLASQNGFVTWMMTSPRGVEGLIVSMLYVMVVAGRNVTQISNLLPEYSAHRKIYDSLPSLFQCLALLPALWQCAMVKPPEALRVKHAIAARANDQFAKCLAALIAMWILFYSLVFLWQVYPIKGIEPWTDFLNNMQAVCLFWCYWTLTAITIPDAGDQSTAAKERYISLPIVISFSLWVVFIFLLADIGLSLSHSVASRFWVQLSSGLAVGVSMALLVGCLESEYLDAPWTRVLTACFYGYAVLQLAYVGFNSPSAPDGAVAATFYEKYLEQFRMLERYLEEFATITSLPLKLLLIAFCFWALKEGRLAFHMEKTRTMIRNVPAEWDEFQKSFIEVQNAETDGDTMGHSAGSS